jgi:DNA-binding NarL/FixJ family response regulator
MPITVLIADDHAVMRDGLAYVLQADSGIHVVGAASNGRDAVREAVKHHPAVAILDIAMPEMNGVEAARQIRERSPETRVVILSMHATPEHVFHALEAGARGYLLKESAGSEVVAAVRAVHAGRRYFTPKIAEVVAEQMARGPGESPMKRLSKREREILQLVAEGHSSGEIGARLSLSPKTVDTYRSRLMEKLGIKDVAGLVKFAIQHGITTLE